MAGCPNKDCNNSIWQAAILNGHIEAAANITNKPRWFLKNHPLAIKFCPWCGTLLTPPEEAGDD